MRQLVHVPVIHSHVDMGSAQDEVRRAYVDRGGEDAWERSRRAIAEFWDATERAVDSLRLDYRKVRLYQDGLPVCGLEEKIVRDLSAQGGPNYRILLKLAERGAALEGTEDPDLLRTEYELIMKTAGHAPATELAGPSEGAHAAQFQELLDLRDRFIARRIDATLLEGEVGILFLGALHHVVEQIAGHDRGRVAARNARGRCDAGEKMKEGSMSAASFSPLSIRAPKKGDLADNLVRVKHGAEALTEAPAIRARVEGGRQAREAAAKYRSLVEQGIAGVYIIREDESVAYINTGFARLCGYAAAEAIGKPFHDFIAESDRATVVEAFAKQITGRRHSFPIAAGIRRKDGTIIDVLAQGRHASYEGRPAVMGVLLDVSERKRAETALREEEAKFRGLVEQQIAGVVIVREDGTLAYVNPQFAKMVGCAPGELIGRPLLEMVPPGEQETVQETIR